MKKYLFSIISIITFINASSQEINKKYIQIKKETYLKTDPKLEIGELYLTNDDYPFEILETHFDERENSYKIKINDEEFWVSEFWCKLLLDEEVLTMQTNWKNKIEKEKELKENEEKLIAENIRKEKEEKEKLIAENFRRKKETNDKIALTKSKRLEYLKKKYGKRGKDIYDGKFWIGMSRAALIDSLGNPESINKSVSKWGIHEQFVYDNYLYIYVENNIVTSYQKSE